VVRRPVGAVPALTTPPPAPAVIDQENCLFTPHVVGLVAGQKLAYRNSDAATHGLHTYLGAGGEDFHEIQRAGSGEKVREVPLPAGDTPYDIRCDLHPWMEAHALITDHPHFAVTAQDGSFSFTAPPGTYELQSWHPHLGFKTARVTVPSGDTVEATLPAYAAADYKAP
jgi:plastocyanin